MHMPTIQISERRRPLIGLCLGVIGMVIFGATLPVTRLALQGFDAVFLMFSRAFLASIAAGATLLLLRRSMPWADIGALAMIGLTLVFGFPMFINVAMQTVPASHGGIVLGVLPLLTAVFAALIGGERPGLAFWVWGLVGAVIVLMFTLRGSGFVPGIGHVWLGCGAIISALGYVISGKLSRRLPGWEVICWALVICAPFTGLGTFLTGPGSIHTPNGPELWALAYLALGSMFGGFFFWNAGLAMGGIARVGQVQLLQTFVTLGFSALLLGEVITTAMLGYAAAVAVVVWLGRKARVG
ncbi:MAG: drug/metabolite transporter (DMT)-like permease [Pseudorhodobacter sp.]|jgi:drug/metabolite transporter (DMT)-like permease